MATAPQNHAAETADVYADLFAELDGLTAASDDTQETVEAGLETALAEHAAATPPVNVVVESETTPSSNAPTAPAVATQVETQVEALVRANVEKMHLEQRLAERTQELEQLRVAQTAAPAPDYFTDVVTDLTTEESENFADVSPTIRKLIAAELKKYDSNRVKQVLDDAATLRTQLGQVEQRTQNTSVEAFGMAVNTAIPGIGAKMRTAEWAAFMKQPAPYSAGSGATMQTLWEYAEQTRNIQAMNEIAAGVQLKQDPAAGMVAPGSSRAPAPPTQVAGLKRIPYSQYTAALRKQQTGEMTWEKFQNFQAKFLAAEAAGLVDENA